MEAMIRRTEQGVRCYLELKGQEIRYDGVGILIIGKSRALIRHHINAITPLG